MLCFLKGSTSSFLQSSLFVLIRPCLGKITFPPFCKSFFFLYLDDMCSHMLVWSEHWVFFLLFLQCYGVFLFFIVFFLVGFSFFLLFVGGVSCVFIHLLHSSLVRLFWACWIPGGFLAGRVIFPFCVGLRCVECRSGTIYLSASLGWVAGLYRFSFSGALLRWVRYDWNSGGCGPFFFAVFSLLSALSAGGCLW